MDTSSLILPHEDFLTVFDEAITNFSALCAFGALWVIHAVIGCVSSRTTTTHQETFLPSWRQHAWRRVFTVHPNDNFTALQQITYLACVIHGICALCAVVFAELSLTTFKLQIVVGSAAAALMFPLGYLMTSPYRFTPRSVATEPAKATTTDMEVLSDDDMPNEQIQPQKRVSLRPQKPQDKELELVEHDRPLKHDELPPLPEKLLVTPLYSIDVEEQFLAGTTFTWKQAMTEVTKKQYVRAAHMFHHAKAKHSEMSLDEGKRWAMFYATNILGITTDFFVTEYLAQQQALANGHLEDEKQKPKRLTKRRKQSKRTVPVVMPDPSDLLPYWFTWLGHALVGFFLVSADLLVIFLTQSFGQQQLHSFWVASALGVIVHALILQPLKVLLANLVSHIIQKLANNTKGESFFCQFVTTLKKEIR